MFIQLLSKHTGRQIVNINHIRVFYKTPTENPSAFSTTIEWTNGASPTEFTEKHTEVRQMIQHIIGKEIPESSEFTKATYD